MTIVFVSKSLAAHNFALSGSTWMNLVCLICSVYHDQDNVYVSHRPIITNRDSGSKVKLTRNHFVGVERARHTGA